MSDVAYVSELPPCDFCSTSDSPHVKNRKALYDFKTSWGPWANGCEVHWRTNRATPTLGTGWGQKLVVGEPPERTDEDIKSDVQAAIEAGDWDAFEDAVGDRDPIEFL